MTRIRIDGVVEQDRIKNDKDDVRQYYSLVFSLLVG